MLLLRWYHMFVNVATTQSALGYVSCVELVLLVQEQLSMHSYNAVSNGNPCAFMDSAAGPSIRTRVSYQID